MPTTISNMPNYDDDLPAKGQDDAVFDTNTDDILAYIDDFGPSINTIVNELNIFGDEIESTAQEVDENAAAAANSKSAAASSASGAQTTYSQTLAVKAIIDSTEGTVTSGDTFLETSAWNNIKAAWESGKSPYAWPLWLDFANDYYEVYEDLETGFVRAPLLDFASFSRASSATGQDAFGNIVEVGVDVPRVVYDNGKKSGVPLEKDGENAATWSETDGTNYPIGSAANWAQNLRTVRNIVLDDQVTSTVIYKDFSTTSSSAVASIFFYDNESESEAVVQRIFRIECRGDTVTDTNIFYNYSTKVFSQSGSGEEFFGWEIIDYGGGFYRLILFCDDSAVTNITDYRVATYSNATYNSTLGGLQVEIGTSAPSSYMKTQGAPALREPDKLKIEDTHASSSFTLFWDGYCNFSESNPLGRVESLIGLTDGTFDNTFAIGRLSNSTGVNLIYRKDGAYISTPPFSFTLNESARFAATYENNIVKVFRNGTKISETDIGYVDTSIYNTVNMDCLNNTSGVNANRTASKVGIASTAISEEWARVITSL